MKRLHYAILTGEVLSYALIITFIFADTTFNLTSVLRHDGTPISTEMAWVGACLVGIVGAINVWLTYYYMQKANTIRDWVIVCAWTHRIKRGGQWLSLEEFLKEHLGYEVSHGLSEEAYLTMRDEIDSKWRNFQFDNRATSESPGAPDPIKDGTTQAGPSPSTAT